MMLPRNRENLQNGSGRPRAGTLVGAAVSAGAIALAALAYFFLHPAGPNARAPQTQGAATQSPLTAPFAAASATDTPEPAASDNTGPAPASAASAARLARAAANNRPIAPSSARAEAAEEHET